MKDIVIVFCTGLSLSFLPFLSLFCFCMGMYKNRCYSSREFKKDWNRVFSAQSVCVVNVYVLVCVTFGYSCKLYLGVWWTSACDLSLTVHGVFCCFASESRPLWPSDSDNLDPGSAYSQPGHEGSDRLVSGIQPMGRGLLALHMTFSLDVKDVVWVLAKLIHLAL